MCRPSSLTPICFLEMLVEMPLITHRIFWGVVCFKDIKHNFSKPGLDPDSLPTSSVTSGW